MLGDQCRVFVDRVRISLLDRRSQAPMPLGAIGFQLRLVGHRADQRVAKGILGVRGEPHLIDQLRAEKLVDHRIDPQRGQQLRLEAGPDHRRRVQRALGRVVSRSMRASMAACTVAGTLSSATSA